MSVAMEHHDKLSNGVGKCSVPMWMNGGPAGFCDEPAFGRPTPCAQWRDAYTGEWKRYDGRYNGYVPGLACPGHAGPRLVTQKDGDAWMAALPGFTNIQECETGWGSTQEEAEKALIQKLTGEPKHGS